MSYSYLAKEEDLSIAVLKCSDTGKITASCQMLGSVGQLNH